jgi:voltage-gated potassium channel
VKCPVNNIGRLISMLSSLLGVAIIALPPGVIPSSYLEKVRHRKKQDTNEAINSH